MISQCVAAVVSLCDPTYTAASVQAGTCSSTGAVEPEEIEFMIVFQFHLYVSPLVVFNLSGE